MGAMLSDRDQTSICRVDRRVRHSEVGMISEELGVYSISSQ